MIGDGLRTYRPIGHVTKSWIGIHRKSNPGGGRDPDPLVMISVTLEGLFEKSNAVH